MVHLVAMCVSLHLRTSSGFDTLVAKGRLTLIVAPPLFSNIVTAFLAAYKAILVPVSEEFGLVLG